MKYIRGEEWQRGKSERSSLRHRIWERDGGRCVYCSRPLHKASMSIDHEVARARGGSDAPTNLVLSCLRCNSIKSSMTLGEFRERMKWQLSNMPYFSPDQLAYLRKWHDLKIVPKDSRFWFERREQGDPPMIRPGEHYSYDGEKNRRRRKEREK